MFVPHFNATSPCFQLNAFDSRHLDEIYFDVRLTAFQDAARRVTEMRTLDLNYIITLIHNCFHTYEVGRNTIHVTSLAATVFYCSPSFPSELQIGDMSLGDNATLCLSAVITQLAVVGAGEQIYKNVVQHTILDAVIKGLRSKTEVGTKMSDFLSCH